MKSDSGRRLVRDLISLEYIGVDGTKGAASFEAPVIALIKAMPDVQWKIQELFGEDEKIVVRWKVEGTQTGVFNGFPATGKQSPVMGWLFLNLKQGK